MVCSYLTNPLWRFGLSQSARILPLAFVSSWALSLHALPERIHDCEESVNNLLLDLDSTGSIGHGLHEVVPEGQSLSDLMNDNVKLQQRLTQQQLKADVDYLLNNNANTIRDRAHLHSLSSRGAGWSLGVSNSVLVTCCTFMTLFLFGNYDEVGM